MTREELLNTVSDRLDQQPVTAGVAHSSAAVRLGVASRVADEEHIAMW